MNASNTVATFTPTSPAPNPNTIYTATVATSFTLVGPSPPFWDAMMLRAAHQAGCSVLLSEDMQEGREIDGIQVVNPFL
jgi:predicted nucleic acid-binding protein